MGDFAVDFLKRQMERGKTMSAYLFSGSDGERKKETARAFAKALNCEKRRLFEPCDCPSCHKIQAGIHPDVQWYGADEEESSIKIDTIRELQNWLSLKPYEGKVKVFILNEAGRLTRDAQNALLKSLEEPPPQSVLVLLVRNKTELLETVVSRLAGIGMTPYAESELAGILEEEGASKPDARFLARFSAGNLEQAREWAGSSWVAQKDDFLKTVLNDPVNGLERLAAKSKEDVIEFLNVLSGWVRDACFVRSRSGSGREGLFHENRLKELISFSDFRRPDELFDLFDAIEETKSALEDNVNQKLALARLQVIWNDFFAQAEKA